MLNKKEKIRLPTDEDGKVKIDELHTEEVRYEDLGEWDIIYFSEYGVDQNIRYHI